MRFTFRHRPLVAGTTLVAALALTPLAAQQQQERVDYEAIYQIKDEGFQRSQVMNIMSWLTDVYGPRLTNAPGFRKAGDWAVKEMTSWGYERVQEEDMRKNAVIVASFVYHTANRDHLLPRKPLPRTQGAGRGTR